VVQGGGSTRRVAAFCSHPDELQVSPDRLTLPPGALTEINLAFRPLIPGRLDVAVHLVDLEKGELVHSRLVATDARGPVVSKTFDVDAAPGTRAHKKITYTNPYPRPRTFNLRCTHPLLLHFRPDKLDLPAGGSRPMGLTFEPAEDWVRAQRGTKGGPAEVLVFINDEDDATEECFRIRVNADPQ
jgi:nephrocystin-4